MAAIGDVSYMQNQKTTTSFDIRKLRKLSQCIDKTGEDEMADTVGGRRCDGTCGCPSPCPGDEGCRCVSGGGGGGDSNIQHVYCKCGEHCGCNPCTCAKNVSSGVGKAFCTCGSSCTCESCAA